jgi:hypothetical protein
MFLENFDPIVKKVLIKGRILRVVRLKHSAIEASDLFGFRGKANRFA